MNARHRSTLAAIFTDPIPSSIPWRNVETLFRALQAEISEGRGSRVRVELGRAEAVFHRPHSRKEIHRSAVKAVRRFLLEAGVDPP